MLRGPFHDATNALSSGTQTQHCRTRLWRRELRSRGCANPQTLANVWKMSLAEMEEHFSLHGILTIFPVLLFLCREASLLERISCQDVGKLMDHLQLAVSRHTPPSS